MSIFQGKFAPQMRPIWAFLKRGRVVTNKPILDVMDITATFKTSISVYVLETLSEQVWLYKLKEVMRDIEKALKSGQYYYVLRIDVRGYYATIERKELLKLLQKTSMTR